MSSSRLSQAVALKLALDCDRVQRSRKVYACLAAIAWLCVIAGCSDSVEPDVADVPFNATTTQDAEPLSREEDVSDRDQTVTETVGAAANSDFDGNQAFGYLNAICALGARYSGSPGMLQQQELLTEHFTKLGGTVSMQPISGQRARRTGRTVPMANLIVTWHPDAKERILLCAHYDTRPRPDQDRNPQLRRTGTFIGANDGASGVAALMELARHMPPEATRLGVDFVLFDAEEYVFDDNRDEYFIGSTHFAQQYRRSPPPHRYLAGVLLDMVADTRLSIYQEQHSVSWSDTRPIVKEIWSTAERLGVSEFKPRVGYLVKDDHLPLHEIGRIPVCDVIDFAYPDRSNRYWHTTNDVPANCSAESIGKVGRVILAWLRSRM